MVVTTTQEGNNDMYVSNPSGGGGGLKQRFRTKFINKMLELVGWVLEP